MEITPRFDTLWLRLWVGILAIYLLPGAPPCRATEPSWIWAQKTNVDARAVAVDPDGNAYIGGWFSETNSFGTNVLSPADGFSDIFLVKVNPQGNYLWANCATGAMFDRLRDVAVDPQGNVLLTGEFSRDLVFGSHRIQVAQNDSDVFIAKSSPNGAFLWAVRGGGEWNNDTAYGVAADPDGNVIVVGECAGGAVFGAFTNTLSSWSYFIAKLNSEGQYLWAKYGRTTSIGNVWPRGVEVDAASNIYVIGTFDGGNVVVGTSTLATASSQYNLFVMKWSAAGNGLWAVQGGQTNLNTMDQGDSLAIDSKGNILITGQVGRRSRFGPFLLTSTNTRSLLVAKLDSNGSFLWATNATGTNAYLGGDAIACGGYDSALVCGAFEGTAVFGTHAVSARSNSADVFVTKLSSQGEFLWAVRAGGNYTDFAYGIATFNEGDALVAGTFKGPSDFGATRFPGAVLQGNWRDQMFAARIRAFTPPRISNIAAGDDRVTLDCADLAGSHPITLERSPDLTTNAWDPVTNWIPDLATGRVEILQEPEEPARFYRLRSP